MYGNRLVLNLVTICSLWLLSPLFSPVQAAESALAAAPAIVEAVVKPGETTIKEIQITNTTSFPLPIKGQASAFLSTESIPDSEASKYNSAAWFRLDPADFILQPHSSQIIKVFIEPPEGSEPGGHYATVFFAPLIPPEALTGGASLGLARIGILAFLIVPGDLHESLLVDNLSTTWFQSHGPIQFSADLTNLGNIHLLPTGSLSIKNTLTRKTTEVPLTSSIILPGSGKKINMEWDQAWLFGKYQAVISLNYGAAATSIKSNSFEFWVLPWQLILILILVLTFIFKFFIVGRRRLKLALRVMRGLPLNP